ncbi:hypothetical protein BRN01_19265 [Xanthomonas oryzae pv. oryzae]|nr:hypothetical protein CDO11_00895 [Xanthomonas oryzae pv. oryzae]AXQ07728.1 hypothetical protein BCR61_00920 [Xanthomonas oryzae pv. oryzae]AXQ73700.1 hypothetical protein BXU03_00905 [Xanthomonas oryzae pv. oryzae]RBB05048.1 hypothetical protein BRN92_19660 [Xanthomonas oryzae pv. oryzae]RBE70527.1 hypothetical protein BRN01_19265 [Xanthomonas oryzae pv. oryzae]
MGGLVGLLRPSPAGRRWHAAPDRVRGYAPDRECKADLAVGDLLHCQRTPELSDLAVRRRTLTPTPAPRPGPRQRRGCSKARAAMPRKLCLLAPAEERLIAFNPPAVGRTL